MMKPIVLSNAVVSITIAKPICNCHYQTLAYRLEDGEFYVICVNCMIKSRLDMEMNINFQRPYPGGFNGPLQEKLTQERKAEIKKLELAQSKSKEEAKVKSLEKKMKEIDLWLAKHKKDSK